MLNVSWLLKPIRSLRKYLCLLQKGTALTMMARVENTDSRKPVFRTEKGFTATIKMQAKPKELRESDLLPNNCPVKYNSSMVPALTTEALKEAKNIMKKMNMHIEV